MRRAPFIAGIFFLLWCASCAHPDRVPSGIIGATRMSAILLDMRLASAYNDTYVPDTSRTPASRELRLKTFYAQILELHHTDREHFMKSYAFYEDHPDLMQKLYKIMQDSIDRRSDYETALIQKTERLRRERTHPSEPIHLKDYLMLFRLAADSFPGRPLRIFRPDGWRPPVIHGKLKDFMWLYKTVADSIHDQPRRILDPDLFN